MPGHLLRCVSLSFRRPCHGQRRCQKDRQTRGKQVSQLEIHHMALRMFEGNTQRLGRGAAQACQNGTTCWASVAICRENALDLVGEAFFYIKDSTIQDTDHLTGAISQESSLNRAGELEFFACGIEQ